MNKRLVIPLNGEYLCPDCGQLLICIYDVPGKPREFACDIAITGKSKGKFGAGYKHADAWVYVEVAATEDPSFASES